MVQEAVTCESIIQDALVELVIEFPIYAQLLTRIGVKVVDIPSEKYIAWTDGTAVFVNKYYVERCNRYPKREDQYGNTVDCTIGFNEMIFILAHEVMHLLGLTWDRGIKMGIPDDPLAPMYKKKHKWWNMATDHEINCLLHNNEDTFKGIARPVGNMPPFVLYDSKYRNKVAEEIYNEIVDEHNQQQQNQQQQQGQSSSGSGNAGGNGGNDSNDDDDDDNSVFTDEDQIPTTIDFEFDKHVPLASEDVRNDVIAKIADIQGNTNQGTGSTAIDRLIAKTFEKEPFNWRRALTKYIRGWMKDNYTWNKPSRAGIANNLILPSQGRTPKMHVAVAIDTSGSVGNNELTTLLNHLFTILQIYKDFQVDVWCVSTQVHEDTFMTFTANNKKDLDKYQIKSDGGTDLSTCFEFIERKYTVKKPDVFILMSDFCDALSGDTTTYVPYPCIWMVIDNEGFKPPKNIKADTYPITVKDGKI